jgi:penicillin-binding protein 1A
VGFDAQLVVGVWVGRDNRKPIGPKETGSRAALPLWIDFMQAAAPDGVRVAAAADDARRD